MAERGSGAFDNRGASGSADARERLIRVMYDCIVHGEYPTVTLDDVGVRAGVDMDTLHRTFATKRDLVNATQDYHSDQGEWLYTKLAEVLADPRPNAIVDWIRVAVAYWDEHREFLFPMHAVGTLDPEAARYAVERLERSIDRAVSSIPGLPERKQADLRTTLQMLFMQLDAVCFDAFVRGARVDRENVVRILSDIWESTLRP